MKVLVTSLEDAQKALDMRRAVIAGILSATEKALGDRNGPPEAWMAVASDLAAIEGFVAALNTATEALHSLRVVRYRESDLPPEIPDYIEKGLSALRIARKKITSEWKTTILTPLIKNLPGIKQLIKMEDLEKKLSECERLASIFLKRWRRFAG